MWREKQLFFQVSGYSDHIWDLASHEILLCSTNKLFAMFWNFLPKQTGEYYNWCAKNELASLHSAVVFIIQFAISLTFAFNLG